MSLGVLPTGFRFDRSKLNERYYKPVESGEVELSPCLRPLAQTARAVFPQAAFLCGRHCGVEDGLMPGTR